MSITFFVQSEPKSCIEDYECQCVGWGTVAPEPNCSVCSGTGKVTFTSRPNELNMSSINARDFMDALGLEPEYCGEIPLSSIPDIKCKLISILNREKATEALMADSYTDKGKGYCTAVHFGRTVEYVKERAQQFLELCSVAQELGEDIVFG